MDINIAFDPTNGFISHIWVNNMEISVYGVALMDKDFFKSAYGRYEEIRNIQEYVEIWGYSHIPGYSYESKERQ